MNFEKMIDKYLKESESKQRYLNKRADKKAGKRKIKLNREKR
ncbi:hypothetical protein [Clostridium frigidicarnis]|uniref:Uncharacterized protein n=1 Tax=Clostridium frigidicarnis TaxID=84698 RepID=A0A1I0V265_9CLOT|nr:hypothetical protein [Clostridium frigidicarnis]SFA70405.1 hypothetical protein SAMN04488528_1001106 [Clostridium frigidicarnis]